MLLLAQMEINVLIGEGFKGLVEESWLVKVAEQVLRTQGIESGAELGLVIVGQEKIRQLNSSYLGEDRPTDVLSFSMLPEAPEKDLTPFIAPPDGVKHLGEVIVSYPQAADQAEEHNHSVKKELAILIIHGILHLLGYDHDEPERESTMRGRESEILSLVEGGLE